MATLLPSSEKNQILAIVQDNECVAAKDIYANLNTYEDLVDFFLKYGKAFDGDNAYLNSLAAIPTDANMMAVGIYYNKVGPLTITNPKIVIKSTGGITINMNSGGIVKDLEIAGASDIDKIVVTNNTKIESLAVVGGSTVDLIEIQPGSSIDTVQIKSENGQNSTINKIDGPFPLNFAMNENSTFGGYKCDVSGGADCTVEKIGTATNTPTVDGFNVAWTNPVNYSGTTITYRKLGDIPWLVPNAPGNATGAFNGGGDAFTFHAMTSAETYQVRVQNTCMSPALPSAGIIVQETTL